MNLIRKCRYINILKEKQNKSELEKAIYFYLGVNSEKGKYVESLLENYTNIINIGGDKKRYTFNADCIPAYIQVKLIAAYKEDLNNQMKLHKQTEIENFNKAFGVTENSQQV